MSAFENAPNILWNAILPFDPSKLNLALGSIEYVAWEVIISKIFRQLLRKDTKSVFELLQVHAASMAFLGGAAGFVAPSGDFSQSLLLNLQDGAKGIPALMLGQVVVDTCKRGFHVPMRGWTMTDFMISAASKAISRPIYSLIYPYIQPSGLTQPLDSVNEMTKLQANKSTLNMQS